jgi:hypothetical protein
MTTLTAERLRALFRYDADTGAFIFITRAARRVQIGDRAGSVNNEGYRHIHIDGRSYKAHRLAWLYVNGEWPMGMVDHINGNTDDNRIANLREASRSQNLANSRLMRRGKLIHKGVSQRKGKWIARIQRNGHPRFLGYFATEQEAIAAYKTAAAELFGSFARVV